MALETEGAHVGEIAFTAAFGYGDGVIGVPETFSAANVPGGVGFGSRNTSQFFHAAQLGDTIETADGADAAIPLEDALAQVTGVGAQLPLFDAPFGTEGEAPARNFEIAPAAEAAPIGTFGQRGAIDWPTLHDASRSPIAHNALSAHENRIQRKRLEWFGRTASSYNPNDSAADVLDANSPDSDGNCSLSILDGDQPACGSAKIRPKPWKPNHARGLPGWGPKPREISKGK